MTVHTAKSTPAPKSTARPKKSRNYSAPARLPRHTYLMVSVSAFVGLLAVWWIITAANLVNPLFLPGPTDVLSSLLDKLSNGQLADDLQVSIYRVMVGYLLAAAMAVPLGLITGVNRWAQAAIEPFIDFVRYMPVVAFVPLTILWVGTDDAQKFLIIWLGTFFQQVLMVSDAVRQVPSQLQNLGATLGYRRLRILIRIVLPAALPRIWDALRISLGWAWTWLVVAELVAATSGMGYRITQAQRYLDTETILGYVIVLGLLGLVFDQIMRAVGRSLFRYQEKGRA